MDNEELRVIFAAFAMLSRRWEEGDTREDAKDCWKIADEMVEAKNRAVMAEGGIVSIKKRSRKG